MMVLIMEGFGSQKSGLGLAIYFRRDCRL